LQQKQQQQQQQQQHSSSSSSTSSSSSSSSKSSICLNGALLLQFALCTASTQGCAPMDPLAADKQTLQEHFEVSSKKLGGGTFGAVYVARCRSSAEVCALKIIHRQGFAGEDEQWRLEVEALAAIQHPNVVKLMFVVWPAGTQSREACPAKAIAVVSTQGTRLLIAMELGDMTLAAYITHRCGQLDASIALLFVRQLCAGVAALHNKFYLHRDLKPRNIVIQITHDGPVLKVADLGSCRWTRADKRLREKMSLSMTPGVCTLPYRAPELLHGSKSYGVHVDAWSIGCIVSELYTGEPLFGPARSDAELSASMWRLLGDPAQGWPEDAGNITDVIGANIKVLGKESRGQVGRLPTQRVALELTLMMLRWRPRARILPADAIALLDRSSFDAGATPAARNLAQQPPSPIAACSSLDVGAPAASDLAHQLPPPVPAWKREQHQQWPAIPDDVKAKMNMGRRHRCDDECGCEEEKSSCQCSGNCGSSGHRYHSGCSGCATRGSRLCEVCECSMAACTAPKLGGPFCKGHRRVFESTSIALRLVWRARRFLPSMLPCDIQVALTTFPPLLRRREDGRGTLHLLMVLAMIKEPTATNACLEQFQKLPDTTDGEQFAKALTHLAVHMSGKQCQLEMASLSGPGSTRFLGLLTTLQVFEIISTAPVDHGQNVVQLGVQQQTYEVLGKSDVSKRFCLAFAHPVEPITSVAGLTATLARLEEHRDGSQCPELNLGGIDVWPHIVRKVILTAVRAGGDCLDWWSVSKETLWQMVPDQKEHLAAFPEDWSAGQIGNMMLSSAADGIYVSMWGSLFQEPVGRWPHLTDEMHKFLSSSPEVRAAFDTCSATIITPSPTKLFLTKKLFHSTPPSVKKSGPQKRAVASMQGNEGSGGAATKGRSGKRPRGRDTER